MNILISSYVLDYSGVPTVTRVMRDEFMRFGHNVTIYSPHGGKMEKYVPVVKNLDDIAKPDVIIAQHTPCAISLKEKFPDVHPFIFYAHGVIPEIENPPDIQIDKYWAINEETRKKLVKRFNIDASKITIFRDMVDLSIFYQTREVTEIKKALFISNYKKWKNYHIVSKACRMNGIELKCVGAPYGRSTDIHKDINEADFVISWGRGIIEAMACTRPVISFDQLRGNGYIDDNFYEARESNFSGYAGNEDKEIVIDTAEKLSNEIKKIDRFSGVINCISAYLNFDSRRISKCMLDSIYK